MAATLIGFSNLGDTSNQLLQFTGEEQYQQSLAKSMLALMVRGLFFKLNYPYAQFTCSSLTGDLMFDPIWEAICRLERLGFRVLALCCDGDHQINSCRLCIIIKMKLFTRFGMCLLTIGDICILYPIHPFVENKLE